MQRVAGSFPVTMAGDAAQHAGVTCLRIAVNLGGTTSYLIYDQLADLIADIYWGQMHVVNFSTMCH